MTVFRDVKRRPRYHEPPGCDVAEHLYHAINRANQRDRIFHKDDDFEAFERVLDEGLQKFPVDLLICCWLTPFTFSGFLEIR